MGTKGSSGRFSIARRTCSDLASMRLHSHERTLQLGCCNLLHSVPDLDHEILSRPSPPLPMQDSGSLLLVHRYDCVKRGASSSKTNGE